MLLCIAACITFTDNMSPPTPPQPSSLIHICPVRIECDGFAVTLGRFFYDYFVTYCKCHISMELREPVKSEVNIEEKLPERCRLISILFVPAKLKRSGNDLVESSRLTEMSSFCDRLVQSQNVTFSIGFNYIYSLEQYSTD